MVKKKERTKRAGIVKKADYKKESDLVQKYHIDNRLWGNEIAEDLAKYIDWHARHPYCLSPRVLVPGEDFRANGIIKQDEDDPSMVYCYAPQKDADHPKEFTRNKFGCNGNFADVVQRAADQEIEMRYQNLALEEEMDPWYDQSVKDHYQDEHSVDVRSRHAPRIWKAPSNKPEFQAPPETFIECLDSRIAQHNLQILAIKEAEQRHGKITKKKIGPFEEPREYSRFTKKGTLLEPFEQQELEKQVVEASRLYKEEEEIAGMERRKLQESEFDVMGRKMGDDAAVEKMTEAWVKYADKVRKMAKKEGGIADLLDSSTDLVDTCNRLNVIKVRALLMSGVFPLVKVEDETLFNHLLARAIYMDGLSGSVNVGDPESADRQKLQKILDLLVDYAADMNECTTSGYAPIHQAAIKGNAKIVHWLLERKANPTIKSKEGVSALMYAGKYGNVYVMGEYIKVAGLSCLDDVDLDGRNALHYCGAFGQTRAAMFLIRVGANKRQMDFRGQAAGVVAQQAGHTNTAQEIFSFARSPPKAQVVIQYLIDKDKPKGLFDSLMDGLQSGLAAVGAMILDAGYAMRDAMSGLFGFRPKGDIRISPMDQTPTAAAGVRNTTAAPGNDDVRPFADDD